MAISTKRGSSGNSSLSKAQLKREIKEALPLARSKLAQEPITETRKLTAVNDLIGRRLCWTGMGFNLLTEGGTLWRPTRDKMICGTVVEVQPHRFYQTKERVSWLKVKLDKAYGRYKYAQAYFDEDTGRLFNPGDEPTEFET